MERDNALLQEVSETIRTIAPSAGVITAETTFLDDLRLDSLATMDLVMALETRFDIIVPMNEIADIQSVGDLVRLLAPTVDAAGGVREALYADVR